MRPHLPDTDTVTEAPHKDRDINLSTIEAADETD